MATAQLDYALELAGLNLPVLPCRGKQPLVKGWPKSATTDGRRIMDLWEPNPTANPGVAARELIVLDADDERAEDWIRGELDLPDTATTRTRRGRHRYFRGNVQRGCRPSLYPGVDVKGNRAGQATGFVLGAGSEVAGHVYQWELHPEEVGIAEAPAELIKRVEKDEFRGIIASSDPIPEGLRNDSLARIAGRLHHHHGLRSPDELYGVLAVTNRRCQPPLSERELRNIAESVARYGIQPWQRMPAEVARWCADPRLTPTETFVLRIGCDYADHLGRWDLSRKQIQRLTGLSWDQVKHALRGLEEKGRIRITRRWAKSGRELSSLKQLLPIPDGETVLKRGLSHAHPPSQSDSPVRS